MNKRRRQYILLPSAVEMILLGVVLVGTIVASNFTRIQSWFYADNPEVITVSNIIVRPLSELLDTLFGDASGVIAFIIFWMLVGVVVYFGIMAARSFSSELIEDASTNKYIMPVGTDKYARLRGLVARTAVQLVALMVVGFCLLLFVNALAPYWVHAYTGFLGKILSEPVALLVALASQVIFFHCLVIALRFLTLRQRLFEQG